MVAEGSGALSLRRFCLLAAVWLVALCAPLLAAAHPYMARNVRVVLFSTLPDGRLVAHYRITLPLLAGRGIANPAPGGAVEPAPFTIGRWESHVPFWDADTAKLAADPLGAGRLVLDGHTLAVDGVAVAGTLLAAAAHPKGHVPPFETPAQASAATAMAWPAEVTEIDSGYVLVDAAIAYTLPAGARRFTLASTLAPGALGERTTTNVFADLRSGAPVYYRVSGLLETPVVVAPGWLEGMRSFVSAGAAHILGGPDHLLFLLCLVLGVSSLGALAWRITGFTAGHAITLAVGFYGLLPQPAWFAPAIDAAIAASIVIAGAVALLGRGGQGLVAVTLLIGLIHGFGFSFALRDMLSADGPNVLPGLAGFNIGVELAQLLLGLAVFGLFRLLRRWRTAERGTRVAAVSAAMAVAVVWLFARMPAVWLAATGGTF